MLTRDLRTGNYRARLSCLQGALGTCLISLSAVVIVESDEDTVKAERTGSVGLEGRKYLKQPIAAISCTTKRYDRIHLQIKGLARTKLVT